VADEKFKSIGELFNDGIIEGKYEPWVYHPPDYVPSKNHTHMCHTCGATNHCADPACDVLTGFVSCVVATGKSCLVTRVRTIRDGK